MQLDTPKQYNCRSQCGTSDRTLKQQGRYDNALIIVTADHGESFTERELWFDHGTTAHEEQLRSVDHQISQKHQCWNH